MERLKKEAQRQRDCRRRSARWATAMTLANKDEDGGGRCRRRGWQHAQDQRERDAGTRGTTDDGEYMFFTRLHHGGELLRGTLSVAFITTSERVSLREATGSRYFARSWGRRTAGA